MEVVYDVEKAQRLMVDTEFQLLHGGQGGSVQEEPQK